MTTSNQGLSTGAGPPAPVDSRPEAIKAKPVRHWGRWISAVIVIYLVIALLVLVHQEPQRRLGHGR